MGDVRTVRLFEGGNSLRKGMGLSMVRIFLRNAQEQRNVALRGSTQNINSNDTNALKCFQREVLGHLGVVNVEEVLEGLDKDEDVQLELKNRKRNGDRDVNATDLQKRLLSPCVGLEFPLAPGKPLFTREDFFDLNNSNSSKFLHRRFSSLEGQMLYYPDFPRDSIFEIGALWLNECITSQIGDRITRMEKEMKIQGLPGFYFRYKAEVVEEAGTALASLSFRLNGEDKMRLLVNGTLRFQSS